MDTTLAHTRPAPSAGLYGGVLYVSRSARLHLENTGVSQGPALPAKRGQLLYSDSIGGVTLGPATVLEAGPPVRGETIMEVVHGVSHLHRWAAAASLETRWAGWA